MLNRVYINQGIAPLSGILSEYNAGKVLLVRGRCSFSLMEPHVMAALAGAEVSEYVVSGFGPDYAVIRDAISLHNSFKPDLIVSVGGGKVLDTAKAVRVLAGEDDVHAAIKNSRVDSSGVPLVAIPTTAGTGAEATQFAVVYIDRVKHSIDHIDVLPDHAIIDSAFIRGASKHDAAAALFDALCQSIEAYWSVRSTSESKGYSEKSIALLMRNLDAKYDSRTELNAEDLVVAAYYSGRAVNIARTTAPHALSYSLTTKYGISHGHAVAILLAILFGENLNPALQLNDKRGHEHVMRVMSDLLKMMGCATVDECMGKWRQYMQMVGLETDLRKMGVNSDKDVEFVVASANRERLGNHPVVIREERIFELIHDAIN